MLARRLREIVATLAVALFGVCALLRRLADYDLPWHVAQGRVLVETRGIPSQDPLAYTHGALKYVEVLSDAGYFAFDHAFGPVGLQLLGAAACVLLALALLRATAPGGDWGRVVVFVALSATASWLIVRPQLFSFALLAVVFAALERHREAPASREGRRALVSLVVLQLVWANVHGAAPLGAMVLVVYALHRLAASRAAKRAPSLLPAADGTHVGETLLAAGAAVVATCANPAGPRLLLLSFRAGEDLSGIAEWERPTLDLFASHEPLAIVVVVLAVAAFALGRDPETKARTLPLFDLLLAVAACTFMLRAVRLVPVAMIVLAYVAGRRDLSARVPQRALGPLALLLSVAPAVVLCVRTESRGLGFAPRHYPDGAVAWIASHHPKGNMWNFMPFGGWLAYRLYPEQLVFMDGRNALARDASLVSLSRDANADPGALDRLVRDFDVQWAVSDASSASTNGAPFVQESKRWAMVYMDDVAAIYVRRDGIDAGLASDGYEGITRLTEPGAALYAAMARDGRAGAISHDGALAAAQDPRSVRAAFFDGAGGIAARDEPRLRRAAAHVRALAPAMPLADALLQAWDKARP